MSRERGALGTLEQAQKQAVERAHARVVELRRTLAQRDQAHRELAERHELLSARLTAARAHSSEVSDVQGLRWAHEHTLALDHERRALATRLHELMAARAALAGALRSAERQVGEAEVARRAVGTVLEKRERERDRAAQQREEDALHDAFPRRPR